MSSLAATQADGYYVPPEYFDSGAYRKQTRNQFAARQENRLVPSSSSTKGTKRQRGHNQWLQDGIVRFELPYKGICGGCCGQSIGRGTRYNAHKTTVGRYHTTPIYQFEMHCRQCQHPWTIRTNPQERGFDYVTGIKIQAEQETNLALEQQHHHQHHQYPEDGRGDGGAAHDDDNVLVRLEEAVRGKHRALTEIEELQRIQKLNQASTLNDADNNALLRQSFRKDRREKRSRLVEGTKKGWRNGMEVLPVTIHDRITANDVVYGRPKDEEKKRLSSVRKSSIFSSSRTAVTIPKRNDDDNSNMPEGRNRRRSLRHVEVATIPSPVRSNNIAASDRERKTPFVADVVPSSSRTELASSAHVPRVGKLIRRIGGLVGPHQTLVVMKSDTSTKRSKTYNDSPVETVQDDTTSKSPVAPPSSSFLDMMAAYESDDE